jgi:hypothetical protein
MVYLNMTSFKQIKSIKYLNESSFKSESLLNWLLNIGQEINNQNIISVDRVKATWKSMNVPYNYKQLKITNGKREDNGFAQYHNNYGLGFDQFGNPV